MRGPQTLQGGIFSYVSLESRIPEDHPLRAIRRLVDAALEQLSRRFDGIYAKGVGRPSVPPEQLLRALLLQVLYTIRSERQLIEQIDYNLLYRWFVGLELDEEVFSATVFTKNRERLLTGEIAQHFFEAVLAQAESEGLVSSEHFTVDGTLIEAWASQKSFARKDEKRRDDDDPGNPTVNFRGEKRRFPGAGQLGIAAVFRGALQCPKRARAAHVRTLLDLWRQSAIGTSPRIRRCYWVTVTSLRRSRSSRQRPQPITAAVNGSSANMIGNPVSSRKSTSRFSTSAPPPESTIALSAMSAASSGGVRSSTTFADSTIALTGSTRASRTSSVSISRVLGTPATRSRPLTIMLFVPSTGYRSAWPPPRSVIGRSRRSSTRTNTSTTPAAMRR